MDFESMTEKEAFKAGFKQYCEQHNITAEALIKAAELPRDPSSTTFGYLTDTNKGLAKDVSDYFTHYLPETWAPWTQAFRSADARYKNLPNDRNLLSASRYAAVTAPAAAASAAALAAGAPAAAATAARTIGGRALGLGKGVLGWGTKILGPAAVGTLGYLGGKAQNAGNALAEIPGALAGIPGTLADVARAAAGGAAMGGMNNLPNLALTAIGLPAAIGLAGGGALGWGAAKLTEPKVNEDDIKSQEIETAYRVQAQRMKARREYEQYRRVKEQQKAQENI